MADYGPLISELTARGFRFIGRAVWENPSNPVTGPAYQPSAVTTSYIHWPGATSLPADVGEWMSKVDASRDYSFFYSWVFREREVWLGRGWEFRNAANSGGKVPGNANHWSQSLLVYRPIGQAASEEECEAAAVVSYFAGQLTEEPHSDVEWTDCPGDGMRAQINAGSFNIDAWPRTDPEPPPEPEPEPEPEPMAAPDYIATPPSARQGDSWLAFGGSSVRAANINDVGGTAPDGSPVTCVWDPPPPIRPIHSTVEWDNAYASAGLERT